MVPFSLVLSFVLALYLGSAIAEPPSNLPPEPPGVFTVRGSSIIDADLDTTWAFLLDFSSYPDWNPFVRSAVVTDVWGIPLDDQVPHLNSTLRFNTQIPPLPAPVNASTPSKLLNDHLTIEAVIHLDLEHHIVAWGPKGVPESILRADRWSSVSSFVDEADGRTKSFYESRQVYSGGLASTVQALLEDAINESFQAQADEMKRVLE